MVKIRLTGSGHRLQLVFAEIDVCRCWFAADEHAVDGRAARAELTAKFNDLAFSVAGITDLHKGTNAQGLAVLVYAHNRLYQGATPSMRCNSACIIPSSQPARPSHDLRQS